MEKSVEKIFTELKEDISTYVKLGCELLKMHAYERVAKVLAILSYSAVLVILVFFTFLFLFLALGFYFGELLDSTALGFLLVAGIYIILFVILMSGKEKILAKVMNGIVHLMMDKDNKDDENTNNSAPATPDGTSTGESSSTGARGENP